MNSQSQPMTQAEKSGIKARSGALEKAKSRRAITIGLPTETVFAFWRDFSNLATFMKDIRQISVISPTRSHWEVELKSGASVEWDAVITEEISGERICWTTQLGSDVAVSGEVRFTPTADGKSTVVSLSMDYALPGGLLAEWSAFFSGEDPDTLTLTNLKRLKAVLETGEYPTIEGQPSGRAPGKTTTKH